MTNVILCGGSGTRLWPISRSNLPKQFLKMFDNRSLFQLTLLRNVKYSDETILVANATQYFIAKDQFQEIQDSIEGEEIHFLTEIVEPMGRNTAASIALAALSVDPDTVLLVSPSDHLIDDNAEYAKTLERAKILAEEGYLVTFGISPSYPETGFGYIEAEGEEVLAFHEKPSSEKAREYIEKGNYFWNSGMFCFKASVYLEELERYAPEIYSATRKACVDACENEERFIRIATEDMIKIPEESIDYAVMEKSRKIRMVPAKIHWRDVGSFDSLDNEFPKDENGNTLNDNLVAIDSKNNFIFGKYKTTALIGVKNLIIVDTPTALLVCKKGEAQKVKELVTILKEKDPALVAFHRTVYKPWGKFTNLEEQPRFKVKNLHVYPGARLSRQKHFHRSEHWVAVRGTALVELDGKEFLLRPNESTYIPIGVVHRLSNPGKLPLEIIEVQVGEYLGEDDIVRYDDDYGRVK